MNKLKKIFEYDKLLFEQIRNYKTKARHLEILRDKKARKKRMALNKRPLYEHYQLPVEEEQTLKIIKVRAQKKVEAQMDVNADERNKGDEAF